GGREGDTHLQLLYLQNDGLAVDYALKPAYARTRSRFRDGTPSGRRSCVARGADKRGRLSGCRSRFSQDFQSRRRQEAPTPTRPLGVAQAAVAAQDVGFWGEQTFAPDGFIRSGPRNVLSLGGALGSRP